MSNQKKYVCDPTKWVDEFSDEFFRFAVGRVKDHAIAEDLVQDTFLSALKSLGNFRGDCPEKSWLYNILRNKIIDHFRKKTNQELKHNSSDAGHTDEDAFLNRYFHNSGKHSNSWMSDANPNKWAISADTILEDKEFMDFLILCLSYLPETWSKVFSLKNIDDYTTKEICKELHITPSNLWTIIHRAKLQLRSCLEKNWLEL
ncbi:sigma-70 family RNA polymerase sigma factor [uncultured Draconibacterium sp.]|uniref:sigma-70 family RNA polymerase sigma factor n=1 Tax=uncultured Draconibacterium sp. TaxID=1573823 RepID=UPI0029C6158D|nr:sigma-70 family RNA polymerase sigma factor [uncultured Draconibacterium sp.]